MNMKKVIFKIIFIIILGSLMHFAYEWSGNNFFVGLFCPVNESIFEHTKMIWIPTFVYFLFEKNKNYLSFFYNLFITSSFIIIFYYTYSGIIGQNYLIIDILIFIIAVLLGNLISTKNNYDFIGSLFLVLIYFLVGITMSIKPLHIPLFEDPLNHTYGIYKLP